jgi:hypothetical protein
MDMDETLPQGCVAINEQQVADHAAVTVEPHAVFASPRVSFIRVDEYLRSGPFSVELRVREVVRVQLGLTTKG